MPSPLAYHILDRLEPDPDSSSGSDGLEQKGKFGTHVNRQADFSRSQYMPDLVTENIVDVVRREFAITPPETPDDAGPISRSDYQSFWESQVSSEPWDIYTISEDMASTFGLNPGWAFKTARQHLNQLILQARMRGYRDERLAGRRFRWGGPEPDHPACIWIREQVPEEGLPYHELVDLMQEAKRNFVEDPPSSTHVVHDWCRHEFREVQ